MKMHVLAADARKMSVEAASRVDVQAELDEIATCVLSAAKKGRYVVRVTLNRTVSGPEADAISAALNRAGFMHDWVMADNTSLSVFWNRE